ncbi:MAG: anti-sigma factor domain-containing protein [Clostridia bacterium]
MDLRDKPDLAERLAAEYALGTLRGRARSRFERWMREEGAVARAVAEWEARLGPMAEAIAPRQPPARVWRGIEAKLGPVARERGFFWKAVALVASGAAAAALFMAVVVPPQKPATAGYVAVLSEPKTQKAVLLVSARRQDTRIQVRSLDPAIQVADASLELWALPKGGKPRSLGLVPGKEGTLQLAGSADQVLSDVPMLAVSLEPAGGSKTGAPTGPVLYSGPCVKDW